MSLFTEQVDGVIAATTFLAPSNIQWFGAPAVRGGARRIGRAFPRELERKAILAGLRALLYQSFYGTGGAMPWSPDLEHRSAPPDVAPFDPATAAIRSCSVSALAAADRGRPARGTPSESRRS